MSLSENDVRKVAHLARLTITEEEISEFTHQLGKVLGLADLLAEVPTENVDPLVHAIELSNVLQPDIVQPSLSRGESLQNSPSSDAECFRVPAVLG